MDKTGIRDAATVILVRDAATAPKALMGKRGEKAVFMPDKFVFPGGAAEREDGRVTFAGELPEPCAGRLARGTGRGTGGGTSGETGRDLARRLYAAAIRELWEETGLALGRPGEWDGDAPPDWAGFAALGLAPDPEPLSFVFRAITPPGRPRRFDARFFLADAGAIAGDLDDFGRASGELRRLQWIPLDEIQGFSLPLITELVLATVASSLPDLGAPDAVPFYDYTEADGSVLRIS